MNEALVYVNFWEYSALWAPCFSVWLNCCFTLKGVWKEFPEISSGLGFSPHSWGNSTGNVDGGSSFVNSALTWSLWREQAIKPVRSENFPGQTKAQTWCLLRSVAWAGGSFRAGKPGFDWEELLQWHSLSVLKEIFTGCESQLFSWSHVSFRNQRGYTQWKDTIF